MSWRDGKSEQENWARMNVPKWTGTCAKFQQGRLLMQRYQFNYQYFSNNKRYKYIAESAQAKSVKLAKRMVEHAKECPVCQREHRFDDENFYGVFK